MRRSRLVTVTSLFIGSLALMVTAFVRAGEGKQNQICADALAIVW